MLKVGKNRDPFVRSETPAATTLLGIAKLNVTLTTAIPSCVLIGHLQVPVAPIDDRLLLYARVAAIGVRFMQKSKSGMKAYL